MPRLSLYLLGPPRIERQGRPTQVDTRKAVALLAYLAITGVTRSSTSCGPRATNGTGALPYGARFLSCAKRWPTACSTWIARASASALVGSSGWMSTRSAPCLRRVTGTDTPNPRSVPRASLSSPMPSPSTEPTL